MTANYEERLLNRIQRMEEEKKAEEYRVERIIKELKWYQNETLAAAKERIEISAIVYRSIKKITNGKLLAVVEERDVKRLIDILEIEEDETDETL